MILSLTTCRKTDESTVPRQKTHPYRERKGFEANAGKDPTTQDKDNTPQAEHSAHKKTFWDRKFSPPGKRKFAGDSPHASTLVYIIEEIFSAFRDRVSSRTEANGNHLNQARTPRSIAGSTSATATYCTSAALFAHSSMST
ncbi:hypothetical protein AXF42_Ash004786 [Apostasia shenzhenica]|uniref:Uncharacterized protein n=1 Tax=Apostasia shenzhenica TaxID=1088818 RepID=A0A2I0BHM1_9ASPA|nr:hypothetical protein AXF42_Ash004786 [Apostasia shenzhenica]